MEFLTTLLQDNSSPCVENFYIQEVGGWILLPLFFFRQLIPTVLFKYIAVRTCHKKAKPRIVEAMRNKLMFYVGVLNKNGSRQFGKEIIAQVKSSFSHIVQDKIASLDLCLSQ